jgi:urate oxidase
VIELGDNRYGKSAIRLVKLVRDGPRHTVRDLTIAIGLEGDFDAAHVEGDNANVVATDTMKNTAYALAADHLTGSIERYAAVLARHFLGFAQVARAAVTIDEHRWVRMPTADGVADDAFLRSGDYTRTCAVAATEDGLTVEAGLRDLAVMKTTRSGFSGFPRDRYTTLAEADDRIMATLVSASWRYGGDPEQLDHDALFEAVGATFLDVFAEHHSPSVQSTIWVVGRAILERHPELEWIRMVLPNLHHWTVDLAPFGLENRRELFVATREPYGLIDATVRRSTDSA